MDRATLKATNTTNKILKDYGTDNGYNMTDVYIKPLFEALKAFYTENKTAVGHTITHDNGILYIDGIYKARFATKRSLIPLLYKASENDFKRLNYLEGRILAKQERYC